MMKNNIYVIILFLSIITACSVKKAKETSNPIAKYQAEWVSLRQHHTPKWLMDAKFGIYCHWGIQTLQYMPQYIDLPNDSLIALWKGQDFNADEWAKLFESAGAKFGGVIGWHGSDFKHWNSDLTDYNSYKMGPHIDIVGEVSKAVKKRGMKFLVSYHSIKDDNWIDFAEEGVNKYDPDIFWVDASFGGTKGAQHDHKIDGAKYIGEAKEDQTLFPEKYQRAFISYFYNHAEKEGKEVEFVYKSHDIPPGVGMRDFENGILSDMPYDVWMTDLDMNIPPDWATHGWFYRKGIPLRSGNELVDILVDIVSKNGVLLLNVPPMADGTFPQEARENLRQMGEWLHQNGEAIYGTSPWFLYGEGPTEIPEGNYTYHHNDHFGQIQFNAKDIRFTVKGDNLYAICLGKPDGDLKIRALNSAFKVRQGDIRSVTHLGSGKKVDFIHNKEALTLKLDGIPLDDIANAFKIELNFKISNNEKH